MWSIILNFNILNIDQPYEKGGSIVSCPTEYVGQSAMEEISKHMSHSTAVSEKYYRAAQGRQGCCCI